MPRRLFLFALAIAPLAAQSKITVSGSLRSRLEIWDWFEGNANNSYAFSGNIFRLSFAQSKSSFDWQFELAAPILLGLPNDAVAAAPQLQLGLGGNYYAANHNSRASAMVFPKQGFIRFKTKDRFLRLGRFEWIDGTETAPKDPTLAAFKRDRLNQRLIGSFGWSQVGRSFDGAHASITRGPINYTLVTALPTRGAFQTDGWGNLKTAFAYASATGATRNGEWRILGIYYHDWRHVLKTDSRALAARQSDFNNIRIATFGGHYLHRTITRAGTLNYSAWGVAQTGRWGRLGHAAAAYDLEAGYQPNALPRLKPWLIAGLSHSTGDANPQDGNHGTFVQLLPTPRPYARMPFYNMMNNDDRYLILALRPHKDWTVRGEAHSLRLANSRDLWYLGGGAFQPWSFGFIGRNTAGARSLANLWDVSVDWNASVHVNFNAYYGFADGKNAIKTIYPRGGSGQFAYLEATYKF